MTKFIGNQPVKDSQGLFTSLEGFLDGTLPTSNNTFILGRIPERSKLTGGRLVLGTGMTVGKTGNIGLVAITPPILKTFTVTVVTYGSLSGKTLTIGSVTVTEGVNFTAATSNDATATSLASGLQTALRAAYTVANCSATAAVVTVSIAADSALAISDDAGAAMTESTATLAAGRALVSTTVINIASGGVDVFDGNNACWAGAEVSLDGLITDAVFAEGTVFLATVIADSSPGGADLLCQLDFMEA